MKNGNLQTMPYKSTNEFYLHGSEDSAKHTEK